MELKGLLVQDETMLGLGDQNALSFHAKAFKWYLTNRIWRIKNQRDEWVETNLEIQDVIAEHFSKVYRLSRPFEEELTRGTESMQHNIDDRMNYELLCLVRLQPVVTTGRSNTTYERFCGTYRSLLRLSMKTSNMCFPMPMLEEGLGSFPLAVDGGFVLRGNWTLMEDSSLRLDEIVAKARGFAVASTRQITFFNYNSEFGVGVVARDWRGRVVAWETIRSERPFSTEVAEALATREAMRMVIWYG
ncbi:hypothetical protein Salat_2400900 [Sesamum alatum]|uniref:Uncharacterized protein n=1 Tax=Sesamum alatum TaxID=300844 RepID=A0AAE1XXK2_9LAMI|nr:hypothetical protein Salat_2400900 [Sesamum alatum]